MFREIYSIIVHWTAMSRLLTYGSFTLTETETESGTDSDLDSKPKGYIVLCRTFHIVQTWTQIPTLYFCTGQESESESVSESVSGNVNEPLHVCHFITFRCMNRASRKNSIASTPRLPHPPKKRRSEK